MAAHLPGPPVIVYHRVQQGRVVGRPDHPANGPRYFFGQQIAGLQVPDNQPVPLGAVGVGGVRQQRPTVAHRKGTQAEVFQAFGQHRFVQQDLHVGGGRFPCVGLRFIGRRGGPAQPDAVLALLGEFPLVIPLAVLPGDAGQVRLLAALYLLEDGVGQFLLGRHPGFEILVLRLQISQHVLVVDGGVIRVPQPLPGILDGSAVAGVAVGPLAGHGRGCIG